MPNSSNRNCPPKPIIGFAGHVSRFAWPARSPPRLLSRAGGAVLRALSQKVDAMTPKVLLAIIAIGVAVLIAAFVFAAFWL
jgi:hypothetical protein